MVRGRLRQTDECIGPLLIQTPHPGRDGEWSYQEDPGGLGKRPAASGAKLKDRQSLGGRIMGTPVGLELLHAGILDANFFGAAHRDRRGHRVRGSNRGERQAGRRWW